MSPGLGAGYTAQKGFDDITKVWEGTPFERPRATRYRTSEERKLEPVYDGVLKYFPDAIAAVSRVSQKGSAKHNPGEPMRWAREKSTDYLNCAIRHSLTPDAADAETGELEIAHMAWRVLAQLQVLEEKRLLSDNILPYSGVTRE